MQTEVLTCHDIECDDNYHFHTLADYVKCITDACINACNSSIPCTTVRKQGGRIAGWSEYVQPLREKSLFWHHLWIENRKPHSGVIADCMRRSRAAYHYANRAVSYDVSERIDNCNFWSEVKKIRASRPAKCRTVDGITACTTWPK